MTQEQFDNLLNKVFTIPVTVQNATFPNNVPYAQINNLSQTGFSFTARELLHAIGSKTAALPASNIDECLHSAYLYVNLLDFQGQNFGYRPNLNYDSDLLTNRSNEIGIGIGCLIAHKQFNVPWDTLEPITGVGKKFDYRATYADQNYVYEFKGASGTGTQNKQVVDGLEKKTAMHARQESYNVELVVSTLCRFSNENPRIILTDPPFEGFKEEFTQAAEIMYRLRHLSRIAQFIGNTPLGRFFYKQALVIKKNMNQSQAEDIVLINASQIESEVMIEQALNRLVAIHFQDKIYIGRWFSYWQPAKKLAKRKPFTLPKFVDNEEFEIFQGVRSDLYNKMMKNDVLGENEKIFYNREKLISDDNIEFFSFSDGTIMGFRLEKK